MKWWRLALCVGGLLAILRADEVISAATSKPDLAGLWRLNRDLSEFPRDVGFGPEWQDPDSKGRQSSGGGGGHGGSRGGGSGGGGVNSESAVTIKADRGTARTFHTNGKKERGFRSGCSFSSVVKARRLLDSTIPTDS